MNVSSLKMMLFGFALTLLVLVAWSTNVFRAMELHTQNLRFETRGPRPITAPVAIVAIDDESLNGWPENDGTIHTMPDRWAWPRSVYGTVVDNLKEAGAKIITFDMVFSEESKMNPEQDKAFADACKKAGNVVLGIRFSEVAGKYGKSRHLESVIPVLSASAKDFGVVQVPADHDNFRRKVPLTDELERGIPSLDIATYRQYLYGKNEPFHVDMENGALKLADRSIPMPDRYYVPVNFVGGPASFPTFSFHNVFNKSMDMSVFKDKIVYIGSTSSILHDNFFSPFSTQAEDMPGVEIHANLIDTIFSGHYLKSIPSSKEALLILGLGFLTTLMTFKIKSWQGILVVLVELGAYVWLVFFAFLHDRWMLPLVSPVASIFLSFAGLAAYRGVVEERRAKEIRGQFSRYVSKSIVDEILKDPSKIKLGGQRKEVTILFSDVRGFTSMSESMSAEQVVEILNEYLTAMVDIVIANGGTLDKYVGDAVMAIWGSPLEDPRHRERSVTAAVQMMESLQKLRAKWVAEGKAPMDIGIGLNSGHVVAGNMGHLHYKMDYTVIGDDVNLAARLESANKEMRSHLLISGSTYEGCKDLVEVIEHDPIKVKGKAKAVGVFEVIGWKGKGRADWAVPLEVH